MASLGRSFCRFMRTTAPTRARPTVGAKEQHSHNDKRLGSKVGKTIALFGAGVTGLLGSAGLAYAEEAEHGLSSPAHPWPHNGILTSHDDASIRRGRQLFQSTCSECHTGSFAAYRDLVGVAYTQDKVKAVTAEIEVEDGPHDDGKMYSRQGKPSDRFPYLNEAAARFANGGVCPMDLSLISKARHNGQSYIFALLTGHRDPPAGVSVRKGLHHNPYFSGAIATPKMLNDGGLECEDGPSATGSQFSWRDVGAGGERCYNFLGLSN